MGERGSAAAPHILYDHGRARRPWSLERGAWTPTIEEEEVHGDDLELPLDSLRVRSCWGLSLEMGQHERAMDHVTGIDSYVGFFIFFAYVALVN
jgi:hypothetical protein